MSGSKSGGVVVGSERTRRLWLTGALARGTAFSPSSDFLQTITTTPSSSLVTSMTSVVLVVSLPYLLLINQVT